MLNETQDPEEREDYTSHFARFYDLMRFRVKEILLVSSSYDAFVLEEDGALSDRIFREYMGIGLSTQFLPRITHVTGPEEAIQRIETEHYDLVITMTRLSGMDLMAFGKRVKEIQSDLPIILLTFEWVEMKFYERLKSVKSIDKVFYWTGDTRILLAIIKYIEDQRNVDNDIEAGVQVILLIEDSPKYFSMFLPLLYIALMTQTRHLVPEGVNDLHRLLRMRARPKILMAETYEEGMRLFEKYKDNLLGVISDVGFPWNGKVVEDAGIHFAKHVKQAISDLPVLLQSSELSVKEIADANRLGFLHKHSDNLLKDINAYIINNFGFGDFIFRNSWGQEIARATNLQEFIQKISDPNIVSNETLEFHARKNHISLWLRARTEFETAEKLRPFKVNDFDNVDKIREHLLHELRSLKNQYTFGVITDFGRTEMGSRNSMMRIGDGSVGGKARGIAFLNTMLARTKIEEKFQDVEIKTPFTFVICSEIFERFIRDNKLQEFAIAETDNHLIGERFVKAELPEDISQQLRKLLKLVHYPLAIRSSSILEDSQTLPFAGLYSTFMLPNNHSDFDVRLNQLHSAVKLVYASVFFKSPKEYVKNTNFRTEEERMAVIIQQVVGQNFNNKFYPIISGTAQSYNFYPISHMVPEDGIMQLALGLGMLVVEGGSIYRVSPKYPEMNPPYSSAAEFMRKSQNYFYAIDLGNSNVNVSGNEKFSLKRCDLTEATEDGTLFFVGSTYSGVDNSIKDTLSIEGPRVVTFANVLKYNLFPLADILSEILEIGKRAFGSHIEMEFAVNLFKDKKKKPEFYLLQIRPMITGQENIQISMEDIPREDCLCSSVHPMGNGLIKDIYDIVYVDPVTFDPGKTRIIAAEVGEINRQLNQEKRNYVLIGFGRWGTADPWLGVPVDWHQISNARVVVESNLDGFNVDPSLGSHFFHNLTSLGMGYLHIKRKTNDEFIDWDWLKSQPIFQESDYVKHCRFESSLQVKINARISRGVILKPEKD